MMGLQLRLQNMYSPYFCVLKYARAVKQKVWNVAENRERDWVLSLPSHALREPLRACEARALRARKTLTPRFTDFFTDFEKKTILFLIKKPLPMCMWFLLLLFSFRYFLSFSFIYLFIF